MLIFDIKISKHELVFWFYRHTIISCAKQRTRGWEQRTQGKHIFGVNLTLLYSALLGILSFANAKYHVFCVLQNLDLRRFWLLCIQYTFLKRACAYYLHWKFLVKTFSWKCTVKRWGCALLTYLPLCKNVHSLVTWRKGSMEISLQWINSNLCYF